VFRPFSLGAGHFSLALLGVMVISIPQPDEIVHEAADMRRKGATVAEIAAHLTDSNVPTRRGGRWSAEQVRSILARAEMHGLPQLPATAA